MLGRKLTIITGSSIMVVGAILQASSFSLGQLIAARLITGFGNGTFTALIQGAAKLNARYEHLNRPNMAV